MTIIWCIVPEIWSMTHNFLSFWTVFCPFTPLWTQKIKILKKWKKYLKILSFYKHKWQSYDAWFLRYGVQRTEFFVILDCFLPFYPLTTWIEDFEKKNAWRYYHFTQVYQKSRLYATLFLRYGMYIMDLIIFHFGLFFALLPC